MPDPGASAQAADDIYAPPKANLDLEVASCNGCSRAFLDTIIADEAVVTHTTK